MVVAALEAKKLATSGVPPGSVTTGCLAKESSAPGNDILTGVLKGAVSAPDWEELSNTELKRWLAVVIKLYYLKLLFNKIHFAV